MAMNEFDVAVIGAGTSGLALASELAMRGATVLLVEKSDRIGGTLHVSSGQMSAAGTKLQRAKGIDDTPDRHFDDVMRISRNTADPVLVRKAVDLAPGTIDWLMEEGFDLDPVCPAILHLHEAYRVPRTYWGRDGGRSVLAVLAKVFERAKATGRIAVSMNTRLTGLVSGADGVRGVRLAGDSGDSEAKAGAVVLATGGYGSNPQLFAELTNGYPLYSACWPDSTGDGIVVARALGARVDRGENFLPTFAGIEDPPGSGRVTWGELPVLTPQWRQPWEIYVTRAGARFMAEDTESVDLRERELLRQPGMTFWIVFDARIRREAPPLLPTWPRERIDAAFAAHPSFARADTVADLARKAGLDAAGLARTLDDYNSGAAERFGRQHRPCPIAEPPFFAIKAHGMVVKTPAGVAVDECLRAIGANGQPISGLHVIGECYGGGRLSGNSFVGGMSVTPALSFGRWLGRALTGGA
jgi:fumarate reductase flavoprotein subunit